jgi:hypothetical protein
MGCRWSGLCPNERHSLASFDQPVLVTRRARDLDVAVEALIDTATGLLSADGHRLSQATLDRAADTLRVAGLQDDAREIVSRGCLERELRHIGLGLGVDAGSASAPPAGATQPRSGSARREGQPAAGQTHKGARRRSAEKADDDTRAAESVERAERAERAAREQARRRAQAAERAARRELASADRARHAAERRHQQAVEALRQAGDELALARERQQAAFDAHRRAEQELATP